jgi:hypothetical protein
LRPVGAARDAKDRTKCRLPGVKVPVRLILDTLSKITGGAVFTVSRFLPVAKIYDQIAGDMRLQYSPPKSFHKIELTTINKTLKVQARESCEAVTNGNVFRRANALS